MCRAGCLLAKLTGEGPTLPQNLDRAHSLPWASLPFWVLTGSAAVPGQPVEHHRQQVGALHALPG